MTCSVQEVQYSREGEDKVPDNTLEVFRFVKRAFFIPTDFEKDHQVRGTNYTWPCCSVVAIVRLWRSLGKV